MSVKDVAKILLLQPLFNLFILLALLWPFADNVAFAVVALTVLIRVALTPLSKKTFQSQRALHRLQPELTTLRQKYRDDQQALARETMELYRRHGINPAAGCLPALAQLPILIVLLYLFKNIDRYDLLYGPLLSRFPTVESFRAALDPTLFGIDLRHPDPWLLPIITGILQYLQSRQLLPRTEELKTHEGADFQRLLSQQMTIIFPIMTVFIARSLPAALPLSWSVTTVFMMVQQWWFARGADQAEVTGGVKVTVRRPTKKK
jgi:YidC/Oxa1 family membrane protein insertase